MLQDLQEALDTITTGSTPYSRQVPWTGHLLPYPSTIPQLDLDLLSEPVCTPVPEPEPEPELGAEPEREAEPEPEAEQKRRRDYRNFAPKNKPVILCSNCRLPAGYYALIADYL